eukprot:TRINITY_DN2641_c0_g1_i4.p1 TRINITY_DN2641_c0_g1~~TRINITY_DN2641_c0_g1_i4.p1  ORF type:complete len:210 (+),score=34.16 TRINITY_DN2641_c0_g1_i4:65-694(+)
MQKEFRFKVIVVGTLGTGKTSLIKRFVNNFFSKNYKATVGVDFALKVFDFDEHTKVHLQLWDIAGQERFGSMTRIYYKDAAGAIIVFDLQRKQTWEDVRKWRKDIDDKLVSDEPIPILLVGNKYDAVRDSPPEWLNEEEIENYCKENGFLHTWFKTSAKENFQIPEAIRFLIEKIIDKARVSAEEEQKDIIDFKKPPATPDTQNKGCCR